VSKEPEPAPTTEPQRDGGIAPRSSSARAEVVRFVREKRYEEALALLYQARAEAPGDRDISASIVQLKEFLVGAYAKRLGGLDTIAGPIPIAGGRSPDALLAARYVDGLATFGDIARSCPLGQVRTLQVLVGLYSGGEPASSPGESALPPRVRLVEQGATPPPSAVVATDAVEPAPPTWPQGQAASVRSFAAVSSSIPPSTPPPASASFVLPKTPETAEERAFREAFARGTSAFVQRRFADAVAAFDECDRLRPGDPASAVMRTRSLRDLQS
jgi:hypothetical protein